MFCESHDRHFAALILGFAAAEGSANHIEATTSSRLAFVIRVYAVEPPADTIRP
jgi:hypothetical protein